MSDDVILDINGVNKAFPNVKALSDLSLQVRRGEVMAFVGENGAGKSTLLKILSGDYRADSGSVTLEGTDISRVDPLGARKAGFRLVRQEPEIVPHITAAENIFVGEYPLRGRGVVDFRAMRARTEERHLSHDPNYVAYALWMNDHGIFRALGRKIPFFRYRAPAGWEALPNPYEGIK